MTATIPWSKSLSDSDYFRLRYELTKALECNQKIHADIAAAQNAARRLEFSQEKIHQIDPDEWAWIVASAAHDAQRAIWFDKDDNPVNKECPKPWTSKDQLIWFGAGLLFGVFSNIGVNIFL